MVFALYLDSFLGLDSLVQTFAVAASGHLTARELVNDNHFTVFDNVVFVTLEDDMRFDGVFHVAC